MEFSDPKGIYLQIADRIRERILAGEWTEGKRIPSVREMAVELGVNPNTVARSYQTLVERSVIANQRGKGYYVADQAVERIQDEMRREFLAVELPKLTRTMRLLAITPDIVSAQFDADAHPSSKE